MSALQSPGSTPASPPGCLPLVARLYWLAAGPGGALLCGAYLATTRRGEAGFFDLLFWLLILSTLAVRYLDIRFFQGATSAGEPATMKHWRRYSVVLLVLAAGGWAATLALL